MEYRRTKGENTMWISPDSIFNRDMPSVGVINTKHFNGLAGAQLIPGGESVSMEPK
jgi:hypothetical protein